MSYNPLVADILVAGAAAQTAIVNNILTTSSGTTASDTLGYKSFSVQVTSTGTGGTFIFEGSNDNTNFQSIPVYNQALLTSTPLIAAIGATASQVVYVGACSTRYLRLRIATTITGGSIAANTTYRQSNLVNTVQNVAQATAADLAVTATIASGTVTTVATVTALTAFNGVATTNGQTLGTQISPTTPAGLSIKGTAGRLYWLHVGNPNATAVFVKIFNVAAPTLGTTSATLNINIPGTSSVSVAIPSTGLFFSTAIVLAVTGGASLTDNTTIAAGAEVNYSFI